MLANATRICEAKFGTLLAATKATAFRHRRTSWLPCQHSEQWRRGNPYRPGRGITLARARVDRQTVQVADLRIRPMILDGDPLQSPLSSSPAPARCRGRADAQGR